MNYEVIVSAVRDRADLLDRTLRSMLKQLDVAPARVLVHEDTRPGVPCPADPTTRKIVDTIARERGVEIVLFERNPGGGLGQAVRRLIEEASTEFVFYTQEDFDFVRPVPIAACLKLMSEHGLNHVRFNKRKTMRVKGADRPPHEQFHKLEVTFGEQVLCVSDHWYFQASLWRRDLALRGFRDLVPGGRRIERCEAKFNHWLNLGVGGGVDAIDAARRRDTVRTFIWGGIGEPAFIQHTGHDRRAQGWPEVGT